MHRCFRSTLLIVTLLLAFGPSGVKATPQAQTHLESWKIESFQSLMDRDWNIPNTFLAFDGFHVGYEKDDHLFCRLDLLTEQEQCAAVPAEMGRLRVDPWYVSLALSPTAERAVVIGLPYHLMRDTDLTVLSFASGDTRILAQDHYEGKIYPPEKLPGGMTIDVSPAWSPDGTSLAVERVTITDAALDYYPAARITLIDVETGEARALAGLPGYEVDRADAGSTLELAWSPDGQTIAVSIRHAKLNPEADGIWLFDAASGESTQLVSIADAQQAINTVFPDQKIIAVAPMSWSPDGSRLLFWTGDLGSYAKQPWCFWIDINSRAITALPLPTHPDDLEQFRLISPRSVAWSPDGSMLLAATHELSPLPGESFELIDPAAEVSDDTLGIRLIDVATGESVLLGHVPPGPFPIYKAAWGPDNDVIIAGYYLKLAQF